MSLHAMNRRTFLETAGTVAAATLLTSRLGWAAADHKIDKIGVQLYTVRDLMKDDFDGTIAKVAADWLQGSRIRRILRPHRPAGPRRARQEWS